MSPTRTALPGPGRRSAPQHHAHGRRLCDHCFPAAESDHEQGCEREHHRRRHQRMASARRAAAERGECPASLRADHRPRCRVGHGPSPVVFGSGGCLTSGDECCTRRLTSTLGIRGSRASCPRTDCRASRRMSSAPVTYSPGWRRGPRTWGLPRGDAPRSPPAAPAARPVPAPSWP